MSEKERMLAGELYRPMDPELVTGRRRAKGLCARYNAASVDHDRAALEELLGYATDAYIEPPFFCDYGFNIGLGLRFYANHGLIILDVMRVEIGDDVYIAPNVVISAATHSVDPQARISGVEFGRIVKIGNAVWIGSGVQVLPGATIGEGTTIGAGSVVTKDIPARCVAVGNPCRVVRRL
jgi:maltose O-acetyltransferase